MNRRQRGWVKFALMGATAAGALSVALPARAQDDMAALRGQLEAMKERLAKLEADKAKQRRVAAAAAVEAGAKPRSWKLPGTNTSMNIGGYVKFDALFDLNSSSGDAVSISAAPSEGTTADSRGNGGNFRLHARQTRFWIQTWTPTDWGELRTYIETDFFGAGGPGVLRLRHAFGVLGPVLAGQTWSTFMPIFAGAPTLDFGGPTGQIFVRQAMVRYTHNFGGGLEAQLALEEPAGIAGAGTSGFSPITGVANPTSSILFGTEAAHRIPDAVAAVTYNASWGKVWGAGVIRYINHDTGVSTSLSDHDKQIGWGVAVAGLFNVTPRLTIGAEASGGKGYQKYINISTGFLDAVRTGTGNLETIWGFGFKGWGEYKLTDTISVISAFGFGQNFVDDQIAKALIPSGVAAQSYSTQTSLQWRPVPQVTFGIEYSHFYGQRYNSANATVSRIQASALYRF